MSSDRTLRQLTFVGVKELAEAASQVLRKSALSQERGTVADYPNERSLRYYISEGLLAQPSGKRGLSSVFGYEHLLAILAIKKLQADGIPIHLIKTLIQDKNTAELESLVGEELLQVANPALVPGSPSASVDDNIQLSVVPMPTNKAKDFLQSLLFRDTAGLQDVPEQEAFAGVQMAAFSAPEAELEPDLIPLASVSRSAEQLGSNWSRYEIEPGIELHIQEGYYPKDKQDPRPKLYEMIDKILMRLGR